MGEKELIQRAIELCLAVYRVTDKFPTNEVLRGKLRSASLEIVESIIYDLDKGPTDKSRFFNSKKLSVLIAYLEISSKQNWVSQRNFEFLVRAYQEIERYTQNRARNRKEKSNVPPKRPGMSARQGEIIRILNKRQEGANLRVLAETMQLSKRSISRELEELIAQRIIKKEGVTKAARFIMA